MPARNAYTVVVAHAVSGVMSCCRRAQKPAARAALRAAVYRAYEADGRLDSLLAWQDINTAETWDCDSPVLLRIGAYEVNATASARHTARV